MTKIDTHSLSPLFSGAQKACKLTRTIQGHDFSLTPEKTSEETHQASSITSIRRQLTPDEEKRVQFLKDTLSQLLTLSGDQPSEEQKARIKEIEKELEEITGVKMRSRIANVTDRMLGKDDDEKHEQGQLQGTAPEDAIHAGMPDTKKGPKNPAFKIIQNNALLTQLQTLDSFAGMSKITS